MALSLCNRMTTYQLPGVVYTSTYLYSLYLINSGEEEAFSSLNCPMSVSTTYGFPERPVRKFLCLSKLLKVWGSFLTNLSLILQVGRFPWP